VIAKRSQRLILAQHCLRHAEPGSERGAWPAWFGNKGFEGLSWDGEKQRLWCQGAEFHALLGGAGLRLIANPGGSEDQYHGDQAAAAIAAPVMNDLSSLTLHDASGLLLLLSDESRWNRELTRGAPLSLLGCGRRGAAMQASVPQAEVSR